MIEISLSGPFAAPETAFAFSAQRSVRSYYITTGPSEILEAYFNHPRGNSCFPQSSPVFTASRREVAAADDKAVRARARGSFREGFIAVVETF